MLVIPFDNVNIFQKMLVTDYEFKDEKVIGFWKRECWQPLHPLSESMEGGKTLMENKEMRFEDRNEFRSWLEKHGRDGIGLVVSFDKTDAKAFKHAEALEEALCFGWIDGVLKRTDERSFSVYFTERRKGSRWSEKNEKAIPGLEARGLMTDFGRDKIEEAKKNGSWDNPLKLPEYDEEQTKILIQTLEGHEPALTNFLEMSHSVQRTYTLLYLDAKTEETRKSRLEKIIGRLEKKLKPM